MKHTSTIIYIVVIIFLIIGINKLINNTTIIEGHGGGGGGGGGRGGGGGGFGGHGIGGIGGIGHVGGFGGRGFYGRSNGYFTGGSGGSIAFNPF